MKLLIKMSTSTQTDHIRRDAKIRIRVQCLAGPGHCATGLSVTMCFPCIVLMAKEVHIMFPII